MHNIQNCQLLIVNCSFLTLLLPFGVFAQFDPPAGQQGSLALHKDDAVFVAWATGCTAQRGLQDISQPALGYVSMGSEADALGVAGEGGTLSLGDGGEAVLTFALPISNGTGADFAVFENAFSDTFLELAFVEVSSDGSHFVRFPAVSNTPVEQQIGTFGAVDASHLYNLAGKYRAGYGTPFDLEELKDSMGIDIDNICCVRVIDVVGCIQPQYARRDSRGIAVNEPWNTPFPQGGFDLDGIGVIHQNLSSTVQNTDEEEKFNVFPNPVAVGGNFWVETSVEYRDVYWYNSLGQCAAHTTFTPNLTTPNTLSAGIYQVVLAGEKGRKQFFLKIF